MTNLNLDNRGWQILRNIKEPKMPAFRVFVHPTGSVRVWFEGMSERETTWWRSGSSIRNSHGTWTKSGTSVVLVAHEIDADSSRARELAASAWLVRVAHFG